MYIYVKKNFNSKLSLIQKFKFIQKSVAGKTL